MSYFCNAHNFFGLAQYKLVSISHSHSAYERSFINVEKYKGNKSLLFFSFEPTTRPSIVFFLKNLNMTKLTFDIFCNAYIYMHELKPFLRN